MSMSTRGRIRYRRNTLPQELRKGLRVRDIVTGFWIYTRDAVQYRGGYVSKNIGPDIDPRTSGYIR